MKNKFLSVKGQIGQNVEVDVEAEAVEEILQLRK
ncbi:MAG: hypothetical protein RLZZ471_750 [Actinomycetota bacterium]|jgi:hypothetical protein